MKTWGFGNRLFSSEKAYEFTFQHSKIRPDWELYTTTTDDGRLYMLPLSEIQKSFIVV